MDESERNGQGGVIVVGVQSIQADVELAEPAANLYSKGKKKWYISSFKIFYWTVKQLLPHPCLCRRALQQPLQPQPGRKGGRWTEEEEELHKYFTFPNVFLLHTRNWQTFSTDQKEADFPDKHLTELISWARALQPEAPEPRVPPL